MGSLPGGSRSCATAIIAILEKMNKRGGKGKKKFDMMKTIKDYSLAVRLMFRQYLLPHWQRKALTGCSRSSKSIP